jgi:hypothetical protein
MRVRSSFDERDGLQREKSSKREDFVRFTSFHRQNVQHFAGLFCQRELLILIPLGMAF